MALSAWKVGASDFCPFKTSVQQLEVIKIHPQLALRAMTGSAEPLDGASNITVSLLPACRRIIGQK